MQLSEFEKYSIPNALDIVTVKGKKYRVYTYEGNIANFLNPKVLICYELDKETYKPPEHLMSTDILLDVETIIKYYMHRLSSETFYKYFKSNLGFDEYRV